MKKLLLISAAIFLIHSLSIAEEAAQNYTGKYVSIVLSNGKKISGRVEKENKENVKVEFMGGVVAFDKGSITEITELDKEGVTVVQNTEKERVEQNKISDIKRQQQKKQEEQLARRRQEEVAAQQIASRSSAVVKGQLIGVQSQAHQPQGNGYKSSINDKMYPRRAQPYSEGVRQGIVPPANSQKPSMSQGVVNEAKQSTKGGYTTYHPGMGY